MADANEPGHRAAVGLFNARRYLAAHELWDELWEANEGGDADFYKGLIQASIALHHFQSGNLEGMSKLYAGHRRFLAHFLPAHGGLQMYAFLADMQRFCRPALARGHAQELPFPADGWPQLRWLADEDPK